MQVIERQLGRARFHVKLVDFLCHLAMLLVGALVYLLVAAVADHWLLPGGLGFTGRTIAFAGLMALAAWFVAAYLGPLLTRGINPTYAARTIEDAQSSLKNSLINFLLLRHDRGGVREAVFEAVEQRAASDIAKVQVGAAVDRSPMIRVGYVLVGVLVLCAAYKILSPKDPFQTAARVALPWADIARPSRVQIIDVKPGNAKVYHGHMAAVTATIEGASEDTPVWLVYSTADGQTIDRKLRMKPRPGGVEFQAELPPESDESPALKPGLQQDVTYRVEAGDAVSQDYRLTVVAAPTIVVQQLQYEFPAYTLKPRQTHDKQGDIQAIEGTKVTIFASANQPIQSAYLELDPNDSAQGAAEIVPLTFEGQRAWGTITLALSDNRVAPWRTSYHVRFVNEDGNKSEQPIRHQIDVQRDLPPEVQILAPTERRIEVPENSSRPIEVRAVDPDFELTRLALVGEVNGKQVLAEELLKANADGKPAPQAVAKYVVVPQRLGLKAGDELVYVATAADNRTNAAGSAEPNVATTSSYVIVIVPPVEQPQNPDQPPPMENEQPMPGEDKPPMPMDDQRQPMNDQNDKPQQDEPQEGEKQGEKEGAKSKQPMKGQQQPKQGDKSQQPKQGKDEKGESKSGGQKNQDQKGRGEKSSEKQSEGAEGSQQEGSEKNSEKGAKGQSQPGGGKGQKSSGNPEQENPTAGAAGEQSQEGGAKGQPSGNASEPSGNQGEAGDNTGGPSGNSSQPTRPAHDGDAIERINQLRQQREQESGQPGEKRDGSDTQPDGSQSPMPGDSADGSKGEKNSDTQQRPDAKQGEKASGEKSNGEKTAGEKAGTKGEKGPQGAEKAGAKGADAEGTEGDPPGDKQGEKRGTEKGTGEKAKGEKAKGEKADGEKGAGEKTDAADPAGAKQAGQKGAAGADKKNGEGTKNDAAGAKGGNPQGPMKTEKADEPQPGAGQKGEKKEPGMGKTGESGAGDASKNEKGSGDSQETKRDTKKEMGPDGSEPKESDPSTPSGSKKQSDSKGNDSGDKSGGGKQGPGQSAKQAGNDAAGSNSAGDEGAGAAKEKGKGETGAKGGNQKKAAGQTGAKGNEKGDGSGTKEGPGNAGDPMNQDGQKQKADGDGKGSDKGTGGTIPTGGGAPSERPPGQQGTGEVADSDDANLDYAKKQTDLALQYLKDQEHDPDPELLDRLGWTKEEMQEFMRRWEALQKAAAEDPKASHELDESLRSLGLTPAKNRRRAGGEKSDNARDLRDSGGRSSAPKTYRDQFDNFRKGSR